MSAKAKAKATPTRALNKALLAARTADEVLSALAAVEWRRAHPGPDCPERLRPTVAQWSDWLCSLRGYELGVSAYNERMAECHGAIGVEAVREFGAERLARVRDRRAALGVPDGEPLVEHEYHEESWAFELEQEHAIWKAARKARPKAGIKHPLGVFISGWQAEACTVEPETRRDRRILPRITGGDVHPARRRALMVTGGAGREVGPTPIPLWGGVPARKRVPLLDVCDESAVPVVRRGGLAVVGKLFLRVLTRVPSECWSWPTIPMVFTVDQVMDELWPKSRTTGLRTWRAGEHWPKLCAALDSIDKYGITYLKPGSETEYVFHPIKLRERPQISASLLTKRLHEQIRLDVAFPAGTTSGPVVEQTDLDELMVTDLPRLRALIASKCVAWIPGATRVHPVVNGRVRRRDWVWTGDEDAYPVLTLDDRRRFAFGADKHEHNRTEIDKAFRELPGMVVLDEDAHDLRHVEAGFRVVPDEAHAAIQRAHKRNAGKD